MIYMRKISEKLRDRLFQPRDYPYQVYENEIAAAINNVSILLDAGCGNTAPLLKIFSRNVRMAIGADLNRPPVNLSKIKIIQCDISSTCLRDNSIDMIISRSVLEHVKDPILVYKELHRILKPGGDFIFIVPNLGHYASILSLLIPHRHHGSLVSAVEDRRNEDVFPAYYRSNSYRSIKKLSKKSGFKIVDFNYLNQYPYYFMFNPFLFLIAAAYVKIIGRFECLAFLRGCILVHLTKQTDTLGDYISEKRSVRSR